MTILKHASFIFAPIMAISMVPALAEDYDHDHGDHEQEAAHEPHQHGAWSMFAALDQSRLEITLSGPLADVLGFEHLARNDAQRDAIAGLPKAFMSHDTIVSMSKQANCEMTAPSTLTLPDGFVQSAAQRNDADEPEDGGDHDHDHDHEHEHEHEHDEDHEEHSANFEVRFVFDCAKPNRLRTITVNAFEQFSSIQTVDAVVLSDHGQSAARLSKNTRAVTIN